MDQVLEVLAAQAVQQATLQQGASAENVQQLGDDVAPLEFPSQLAPEDEETLRWGSKVGVLGNA